MAYRGWFPAVHPHVRGDGSVMAKWDGIDSGSPPRAWGRHLHLMPPLACRRFTPTCVGTARTEEFEGKIRPVHPHVRGDGAVPAIARVGVVGSPPRAWGRRELGLSRVRRGRFTPTCVGTARPAGGTAGGGPVHPHVRGDGATVMNALPAMGGSPPRAWGRHDGDRRPWGSVRFTPTCVGTA